MTEEIRMQEITPENLQEMPCCGIKNTQHQGHIQKTDWLKTHFHKGLGSWVLFTDKNQPFGFIEYLPGQYAWRGVEARDYMFIHCLWIHLKKYQRQGYGKKLLDACIQDARARMMLGAAVVARKKPWLANSQIFLKNGFEIVATSPPDYELLVKKFHKSAPDPKFKEGWEKKLRKYRQGLTILISAQCPHIIKFAGEIAALAREAYNLDPRIVELKNHRQAQNAPTPYAVFAIIYEGKILSDHQISKRRFRNIMNKIR
jgi:GNAT superfamily N-acetyltransferase